LPILYYYYFYASSPFRDRRIQARRCSNRATSGFNAPRRAHCRPPEHQKHQSARASTDRHDSSPRQTSSRRLPSVPSPSSPLRLSSYPLTRMQLPIRFLSSINHGEISLLILLAQTAVLFDQTALPPRGTNLGRPLKMTRTAVTLTITMAAAMANSLARSNKKPTPRASIVTMAVPSSVSKLWTALPTRTASPSTQRVMSSTGSVVADQTTNIITWYGTSHALTLKVFHLFFIAAFKILMISPYH
jgi:hypothetical protein